MLEILMGFFKFLRKREKEIKENREVLFGNLNSWIENKNLEVEKDKSVFLELMKNRLSDLVDNLKQCIENLEKVNWEKIKEKERIKLIVKENLESYLLRLKKVVYDLENLEFFDGMKEKLTLIFSNFDKRAGINYQKSNILIGKELAEVNENVRNFFGDINKIQNDNSKLIESIETISNIKEKLRKFKESEKVILDINDEIKFVRKEVDILNNKIKDYEIKIEEMKKSEKYFEWLGKKEKLNESKENLRCKLNNFKNAVDFKVLARIWHENELEMGIVKKYKQNFQEAFQKDKGVVFQKLINSLENKEFLIEELSEIMVLEKNIKEIKLEKDLTLEFEEKIEKLRNGILSINSRKLIEQRRVEKLGSTKNDFVEDIKVELRKIDVFLIR